MIVLRWFAAVAMLLSASTAFAEEKLITQFPEVVNAVLEKATEIEVYSLDGERNVKDGWHGAKVLGKTTVKGDDAKDLVKVLRQGVKEGGEGKRCFIPRHGIRATHDGKTVDLAICFECSWVYIYTDKAEKATVLTFSSAPEKTIIDILEKAKVPLAKPEK
jgi:hypothetical protein